MNLTPPVEESPRACGLATASLMLGIASFFLLCFGPLAALPAIVTGHVARWKIRAAEDLGGAGRALAGLWLGYVHLVAWVMLIGVPLMETRDSFPHPIAPVMNNGRNIYVAIFQASLADPLNPDAVAWPRSGETDPNLGTFDNSTDYFKWMVTSEVLNVDFSFFGAPGIPSAKGTLPEMFGPEHNAWCVVADVDETYPDAGPVLFTRNINVADLGQLVGDVTELSKEQPFGTKGAIVILKGGSTFTVKDLEGDWVDKVVELGLTNLVLRP